MPVSPELRAFLVHQQKLKTQSERDLGKIPRLEVPENTTLDDLHNGAHWHDVSEKLKLAGLSDEERQSIHHVLKGISEIELPVGIFHRPTVGEIRELSDEDLLLLSEAHAQIDRQGLAILRRLFGKVDEAVPAG